MMYRYLAIAALMACSGIAHAQERTAAGATETQMTWSALSSEISTVDDEVKGVNARVDEVTVCGKKGMFYAPGMPGVDSQGCLAPAVPG